MELSDCVWGIARISLCNVFLLTVSLSQGTMLSWTSASVEPQTMFSLLEQLELDIWRYDVSFV